MTVGERYFVEQLRRGDLHYSPQTGLIWRIARNNCTPHTKAARLVKLKSMGGYRWLSSMDSRGVCVTAAQHRVIWEAFVGPIPEGYQINHKDFDKANNRFSNLELLTPQQNTQHALQAGRKEIKHGDACYRTKITDAQLLDLRERYFRGEVKLVEEAAKYGMKPRSLSPILSGRSRRIFADAGLQSSPGKQNVRHGMRATKQEMIERRSRQRNG